MKNAKVILSLACCAMAVLPSMSQAVSTEGNIHFIKSLDKQGDVIKPETVNKEILPAGGSQSTGDLRIQHVPDFQFDEQEIKVGEQYYHPLLEQYRFKEPDIGESGDQYLPHFIQVADVRGEKQGWKLFVAATPFTTADNETLAYANITLKAARLSNDIFDATEIKAKVSTFREDDNRGNILVIPTEPNQSALVMETRGNTAEHSTDGSRTSIVLDETYDKDNLNYLPTATNNQVVFTKHAKDIPSLSATGQPKEYTSRLTWTLLNGK